MSFLAPAFLLASGIAACAVVALHFIVTRHPRSIPFPTARFVPDAPITARARALQLSELLLLAIRVLGIMLVGAALARPVWTPTRERIVRVIAADVSGAVANIEDVRDSARALLRPGDALVAFDTSAWAVASPDSLINRGGSASAGSLSAGLIAALRAGQRVRDGADSVELVVISPLVPAERDRATAAIRAAWPGRARVVRVAGSAAGAPADNFPPANTPTLKFLAAPRPALAVSRNRIDTVGAVIAGDNVIVGQFERRWRFIPDSLKGARVIARWVDGDPAAIERDSAASCLRSVLIPLDSVGDLVLRPSFARFRESLSAPCRHVNGTPDPTLAKLLAGGAAKLATTTQFPAATDMASPLARWLLALAIILAILEMVIRRAAPRKEGA